jgi:hypothetical protein
VCVTNVLQDLSNDLYERLRGGLRGKLRSRAAADSLARELSLLACAFFLWRRSPASTSLAPTAQVFTIHQRSHYGAFLSVILFVAFVETVAVHLLLRRASPTIAYLLSGLSLYGIIWLLGDFRALRLRPTFVQAGTLHIRVGLRAQVRVALHDIEGIETLITAAEPDRHAPNYARCTAFGPPELLVRLRKPAAVERMIGGIRNVSCIGLKLDDEAAFRDLIVAAT